MFTDLMALKGYNLDKVKHKCENWREALERKIQR